MITHKRLLSVLSYDPATGVFRWRETRGGQKAGTRAGGDDGGKGYRRLRVDRRIYSEHRLAWLYMYGVWPTAQIDHKDLKKSNNRFRNLREATNSQNKQNQRVRVDSETGVKGVTEDKRTGRWRAYISIDGHRIWLGFFATKIEAKRARVAANPLHGEFARGP